MNFIHKPYKYDHSNPPVKVDLFGFGFWTSGCGCCSEEIRYSSEKELLDLKKQLQEDLELVKAEIAKLAPSLEPRDHP